MSVFRIYVDYKPHYDFRNVKTQDKEICVSTLWYYTKEWNSQDLLNLKNKTKNI